MQQLNEAGSPANINLGLSYLTIDDVIWRAVALQEPGFTKIKEREFKKLYRDIYGKNVFGGRVVIVRSDLNSPLDETRNKISGAERIKASVPTIKELSDYGAKVVVLAHQGSIGSKECISLSPHKCALEELLKREVTFKKAHWYGTETQEIITQKMKNGGIFLLENIRMLSAETMDERDPNKFAALPDSYMQTLGGLADFYVNDAFSTSHRWHGSIVGFPMLLNIAGRLTEKEIAENRGLIRDIHHPYTVLFGGLKVSGYLEFIKNSLENELVDNILAAGALGIMGVQGTAVDDIKKVNLGKYTAQFLKERGLSELQTTIAGLIKLYPERFVLPVDFKVELDGEVSCLTAKEVHINPKKDRMRLYGLGPKTVALFEEKLKVSKTVYMKGSPTKDDDKRFSEESRKIVDSIVSLKKEGVTTILSGGDTYNLISGFGYSPQNDFSYSTLAGGAATEYLAGILLPGLLMLNTSYNAFYSKELDSGLPKNYEIGFKLVPPTIPKI